MNDRLIRGDQNTSLPYHDQFRGGASEKPIEPPYPQRNQAANNLAALASAGKNNNSAATQNPLYNSAG